MSLESSGDLGKGMQRIRCLPSKQRIRLIWEAYESSRLTRQAVASKALADYTAAFKLEALATYLSRRCVVKSELGWYRAWADVAFLFSCGGEILGT